MRWMLSRLRKKNSSKGHTRITTGKKYEKSTQESSRRIEIENISE